MSDAGYLCYEDYLAEVAPWEEAAVAAAADIEVELRELERLLNSVVGVL